MSKRAFCKYFAHGKCRKGEHCDFSHDWQDKSNNVCFYYQKGMCLYGSRCKYDHVKASCPQTFISTSSSHMHLGSASVQGTQSTRNSLGGETAPVLSTPADLSGLGRPFLLSSKSLWSSQEAEDHTTSDTVGAENSTIDRPICGFAVDGDCPNGENCSDIHGDLCSTCGRHCLHPFRPDEKDEHIKQCLRNTKHIEALKLSEDIECNICLERVLSKAMPDERKFGLLPECDHPFCISCIRNWRSNSPTSGMDVNTALRACPVCRKRSYFVIPSAIWYSTKEEKQEIINSYKAKLRSIDCKYFDFGNGMCPFGTSCFYKHTYKPDACRLLPRAHEPWYGRFDALCRAFIRVYKPHTTMTLTNRLGDLDIEDFELPDFEAEDVDLMMEMAFLLMQSGINVFDSSSDEEY